MEYRSIIYNAARDGNLRRLKVFMDGRESEEMRGLLSAKTFGTPPLVIAARNGHFCIVKYLVAEKRADVAVVGTVTFDGETIDGAPALWAAAAAGHLEIVRLLVENGADVNQKTLTNSTPLRGACFDGHIEIVRYLVSHGADVEVANRHGHTCLMIAAFRRQPEVVKFLLSIGANVNKASTKGNTALHDAAETGSLEILQLLLKAGALMRKDTYGLSPLISAASLGHAEVLEFLLEHPQCFWREKVEALQLAGATCVDKRRDLSAAIGYWKRALGLLETGPPPESAAEGREWAEELAARAMETERAESAGLAYAGQTEMHSLADLEEKIGEPDMLRMQALLIRERILGPTHADTIYYLRYRGAIYADVGRFDRCIHLWMHALRMQQRALEPLCTMTQGTIVSFAELFAYMLNDWEQGNVSYPQGSVQPPAFRDLHAVIAITVEEIKRGMEQDQDEEEGTSVHVHVAKELKDSFHRLSLALLHLVCLVTRARDTLPPDQEQTLCRSLYAVLHLDPRDESGRSLLHLACSADATVIGRFPVCRFPALAVVELLLSCGADPNAADSKGRSPLHVSLESSGPSRSPIVKALLSGGAHLDQKAHDGQSPLTTLISKRPQLDIPVLQHRSLACIAATKLREAKINYRSHLPQSLISFVELH